MVRTLELPRTAQVPQAKPCPGFVRTVLPTLRSAIYQFMNAPNSPGKQGRQTSLRQLRKLRLGEGRDCLGLYNKVSGAGIPIAEAAAGAGMGSTYGPHVDSSGRVSQSR